VADFALDERAVYPFFPVLEATMSISRHARLLFFSIALLWALPARAQNSAIQIGYAPSPTAGTVHVSIILYLTSCGSDAACGLFDAGAGNLSAEGSDAAAVMSAIDAVMTNARCAGLPAFQSPVAIPGATPGEIRHEYPIGSDFLLEGIELSEIQYDRGAMSLALVSPCGPGAPNLLGPYHVGIAGPAPAAGEFKILCHGKPETHVTVTSGQSGQSIAAALIAAAQANGVDAFDDGVGIVGFNSQRYQQDVSALDYAGMSDGSPMALEIGNDLWQWVPTKPETWGSLKARYR
jgi:hypothetical protein